MLRSDTQQVLSQIEAIVKASRRFCDIMANRLQRLQSGGVLRFRPEIVPLAKEIQESKVAISRHIVQMCERLQDLNSTLAKVEQELARVIGWFRNSLRALGAERLVVALPFSLVNPPIGAAITSASSIAYAANEVLHRLGSGSKSGNVLSSQPSGQHTIDSGLNDVEQFFQDSILKELAEVKGIIQNFNAFQRLVQLEMAFRDHELGIRSDVAWEAVNQWQLRDATLQAISVT
jgi:hypothetical protein